MVKTQVISTSFLLLPVPMTDNFLGYYSFSAWCPLKGQAHLSKHAAKSMSDLLVDTKH